MGKKVDELNAIASGSIVQADDLVAVFDLSANLLKKISVADFASIVGSGFDINGLTAITLADFTSADTIPVYDTASGTNKKVSYQTILQAISRDFQSYANVTPDLTDFVFVWDAATYGLGKMTVSDFLALAGGGGLTNWTEATAGSVNDIRNSFTATGAGTDIDAVIEPKGQGALRGKADGNGRGSYAVDWQLQRNAISEVASGPNSTISGGSGNTASGDYSAVTGGVGNFATQDYTRAGGFNSLASRVGEDAWSSTSYASQAGANQVSQMALASPLHTGTGVFYLYSDILATEGIDMVDVSMAIAIDLTLIVQVYAAGNGTVAFGESFARKFLVLAKKVGGTVTVVGFSPVTTVISDANMADITVTATGVTNNLVRIDVTPPTAAGSTSQFVATAHAEITQILLV